MIDTGATDKKATGDTGVFQTAFNMMKVFVGIGILATPSSFEKVGIIGGAVGLSLIGVVALYTMML